MRVVNDTADGSIDIGERNTTGQKQERKNENRSVIHVFLHANRLAPKGLYTQTTLGSDASALSTPSTAQNPHEEPQESDQIEIAADTSM
jgi:hypothetical protein